MLCNMVTWSHMALLCGLRLSILLANKQFILIELMLHQVVTRFGDTVLHCASDKSSWFLAEVRL